MAAIASTCVVVVDEGDGSGWPPACQPGVLALLIPETPELGVSNGLIEHPLGDKIKQGYPPSLVQPVAERLAGLVLIEVQTIISPPESQVAT